MRSFYICINFSISRNKDFRTKTHKKGNHLFFSKTTKMKSVSFIDLSLLCIFFLRFFGVRAENMYAGEIVTFKSYPKEKLSLKNFVYTNKIATESLSESMLKEGDILFDVVGLSVDPYMRGRFKEKKMDNYFVDPFKPGDMVVSAGLGKIIASKNEMFKIGDYVTGHMAWASRQILDADSSAQLFVAPNPLLIPEEKSDNEEIQARMETMDEESLITLYGKYLL